MPVAARRARCREDHRSARHETPPVRSLVASQPDGGARTVSTYFLKRPIDVVASAAVLALLSPVLLGIGAWVRLTSPGPALFRQPRVGRNQETFEILKFRTMVDRPSVAIDQVQEAVVTGGRDERITPAGRVLRASSLDELPQLVNILRGEMSLIGPRPVIPDQLSAVPTTRLDRFAVRPGLTGLAQVSGRRGLDWLDQLAFDSEYVQRCSLLLDIQIVLRTLTVVTRGSGVYGGEGSNWRAYRRTPADDAPAREVEAR